MHVIHHHQWSRSRSNKVTKQRALFSRRILNQNENFKIIRSKFWYTVLSCASDNRARSLHVCTVGRYYDFVGKADLFWDAARSFLYILLSGTIDRVSARNMILSTTAFFFYNFYTVRSSTSLTRVRPSSKAAYRFCVIVKLGVLQSHYIMAHKVQQRAANVLHCFGAPNKSA